MTEWLAIKSDKSHRWTNGSDEDKAARDLEPFDGEDAKSSWAHVLDDHCFEECFQGEPRATRALQALALLIFVEHKKPGERSKIAGVSLLRAALEDSAVSGDRCEHPVASFDSTHRSIMASSEEARREVVRMVFANNGAQPWRYSREQLLPLLQRLLDKGLVTAAYLATARGLLARAISG